MRNLPSKDNGAISSKDRTTRKSEAPKDSPKASDLIENQAKSPTAAYMAAIGQIQRSIDQVEKYIEMNKPGTAAAACKYLYRLEAWYDTIHEQTKRLGSFCDTYRYTEVPKAMAAEKVKTISIDMEGATYRFTVSLRWKAKILEGMKEKAIAWLKKNKYGDIVQETVNANTLSAFAKDLDSQKKSLPVHLFEADQIPGTSITKV